VRFVGFVLALTAGFAAPASALAHGHAHEHEAEAHAAAEHTNEPVVASLNNNLHPHSDESSALGASAAASAGHETGAHPHPAVDAALTAKAATSIIAVVAAHLALPAVRVVTATPPAPERALQFRAEAAHAPPPRLRAPPGLHG
jgi:hypothetical protein